MTAYNPAVHRTVVAANGETNKKFHSVNKILIDMAAAGMINVSAQDDPPGDTSVVWLDLTIPEDGNGQAKVYEGGLWVPLTPEYFALHYAASTQAAEDAATAAAASASQAQGYRNETAADALSTAADAVSTGAARDAAQAAQTAAEQARDEAEIAADNFDDVYLGTKVSDPSVDNDGDPLVTGQLYFNSGSNELRIFNGSSWQGYSAAEGITAVVQDTSPQLGGNLDLNGNVITGLEIGTDVQSYSANLDSWSLETPSDYLNTTGIAAGYQPLSSTLTSLGSASANGVSLTTADDYAAMKALLDLEIGTDVQAYSAQLAAIAALSPSNGDMIRRVGGAWTNQDGATVFGAIKQAATTSATGVVELATDVELLGGTTSGVLPASQLTSASAAVALSGASPTFNWADGHFRTWQINGNRTLPNPSGGIPGQTIFVLVSGNDATLRTLTYGNQFGGTLPVLTDITSTKQYLLTLFCVTNVWFIVLAVNGSPP